ncbi:MAG: hypothetical protein GF329_07380 [Candidatus Lokiarchaeota archaeon]|nr:hypothetical protein [Candidatus Lokiarchaeota archaeon]
MPSVYFYPANNGGSTFKNCQKAFNSVGKGRLELVRSSPRARNGNAKTPFMSTETWVGVMIEAPFTLMINGNGNDGTGLEEKYKVLVLKTLEYLNKKVEDGQYAFMLGGKRGKTYGRARVVFKNKNGNYLTRGRNCLGIKNDEAEEIDKKFDELVKQERKKFPLDYNTKEDKKPKSK